MPLFMDLHKIPHVTIEEAKKAHVADELIQRQYGVNYLQFWVNEEAGNLFCLVEGPDKATVEEVHRKAHGHVACAVVEVDPSYYSIIMGNNIRIDHGVVHDTSGRIDPGTRFILNVSYHPKFSPGSDAVENIRHRILNTVAKYNGRRVRVTGEDSLVNVFDFSSDALQCAKDIQKEFQQNAKKNPAVFTIGLSAGQPVTESNEFIEETVRLARRLSLVAAEGFILMSALFDELGDDNLNKKGNKNIRALNPAEEKFLTECFASLDEQLTNESFTINSLVKAVGMSRAQLYRKLQALTGKAPNTFLRDLRLEKAKSLLRRKSGNISEVAFEVGFSNPSYFAKCFAKRYGCAPSLFFHNL